MSFNASEERLGELTRKTFLSLWSYQNPHYAKGKELCDTLVVFGDDVIIFSDKSIKYDEKATTEIAWKRWYKKAIYGSVRQLRGALNQLMRFPNSIYCDPHASSPFPLLIPSPDKMRVHLVAVANGSEDICLRSLGRPGLNIDTRCIDDSSFMTVGINHPEFIHIFSKTALEAIFDCFDTTRDLIDYLHRKQQAISTRDYVISGEENLVAAYMLSQPGNQEFYIPGENFPINNDIKIVGHGIWDFYKKSSARNQRDRVRTPSYAIDRIIEHIAVEHKSGSLIVGQEKPFSYHEEYFRLMASESRLGRQIISATLLDIIIEDSSTFWCNISESKDTPGLLYLWLVYPLVPESVTDDQLEKVIDRHLQEYMIVAQHKFPQATRIFGICLPNNASTRRSKIFRVTDGTFRHPKLKNEAKRLEKKSGILADIESYTNISQRI